MKKKYQIVFYLSKAAGDPHRPTDTAYLIDNNQEVEGLILVGRLDTKMKKEVEVELTSALSKMNFGLNDVYDLKVVYNTEYKSTLRIKKLLTGEFKSDGYPVLSIPMDLPEIYFFNEIFSYFSRG